MRPILQNTWNSSSVNSCLQDNAPSTAPVKQDYNVRIKTQLNTTTWQKQQQQQHRKQSCDNNYNQRIMKKMESEADSASLNPEMLNIHLKLEEKRRQIEYEKRRQEANLNRQREKLGKAAFLQAVSKDIELVGKNWIQQDYYRDCNSSSNDYGYQVFSENIPQYPENVQNTLAPLPKSVAFNSYDAKTPSVKLTYTGPSLPANSSSSLPTIPQNFSFIKQNKNELSDNLSKKLHISSSADATYRMPSANSFVQSGINRSSTDILEKGFYISFDDNSQQAKSKPLPRAAETVNKTEQTIQRLNNLFAHRAQDDKNEISSSSNSSTNNNNNNNSNCVMNSSNPDSLAFPQNSPHVAFNSKSHFTKPPMGIGLVIDEGSSANSQLVEDEMVRKRERILMLALQRKQQQEEMKVRKEIELQKTSEKEKEKEKEKEAAKARKREEDNKRRNAILNQYRLKKAIEESERDGIVNKEPVSSSSVNTKINNANARPLLRRKPNFPRPRPKTIHISSRSSNMNTPDISDGSLTPSYGRKGSSSSLSANSYTRRNYYRGSQDCLLGETARTSASSICSDVVDDSCVSSPSRSIGGGRRDFVTSHRIDKSKFNSSYDNNNAKKSNSLVNLSGASNGDQDTSPQQHDTDSGLGRATPSQGGVLSPNHNSTSPLGPGSLPVRKRYDDAASESGGSEYSGPRLYKQPTVKSNRGIILNAVEYCVFPGAVNREGKRKVLEEINKSDTKHFLILFRDSGCQFRGLYMYVPENDEVFKLHGTGPKQVTDRMFDKFFKYNSGGKCFSQIHTKHLTVTIDAFTIHNSLWQGKKVNLPNKRDLAIVI